MRTSQFDYGLRERIVARLRLPTLALAVAVVLTSAPAGADLLEFYQVDYNLGGTLYDDTEWGCLDFTYMGVEPIMYLNVAVNGTWQVQNVRVLSKEGASVEQTMSYYFDLGTTRGDDVTGLLYDYAFTDDVLATMPSGSLAAIVAEDLVELWPGPDGIAMPDLGPAGPALGGKVKDNKVYKYKNFPNQHARRNECLPTALSNSLQWLNGVKNLGMDPNEITIDKMDVAVGFDPNTGEFAPSPLPWWERKDNYMKDPNHPLPITTRKFEILDFPKLMEEMDANQDIELVYGWDYERPSDPNDPNSPLVWKRGCHIVCVTGLSQNTDGSWNVDTKDDGRQGDPTAGLRDVTWRYDPLTGELASRIGTRELEYAIVECPEPATMGLLGAGSAVLLVRRRRRRVPS